VASSVRLHCQGAVGFIDWLDTLMSRQSSVEKEVTVAGRDKEGNHCQAEDDKTSERPCDGCSRKARCRNNGADEKQQRKYDLAAAKGGDENHRGAQITTMND
jgi:hypothetical protein